MSVDTHAFSWQQNRNIAVVRSDTPLRFAIFNLTKRQPIILAATAARMWELATQGHDFGMMLHLLGLEYGKSSATIEPFLHSFISELENEGYLKPGIDHTEARRISEEKADERGGDEFKWKTPPN